MGMRASGWKKKEREKLTRGTHLWKVDIEDEI
jgi:hypothetical protein